MKRQWILYGLCAALVGCAGGPSGTVAEDLVPPAATVPQRTVVHARGETAVPSHPQRVVVLTNEATDMVLALGLTPVGAVKSWSGDPTTITWLMRWPKCPWWGMKCSLA